MGGYRRVHGEPTTPGIKVAASTVWQVLKDAGVDPALEPAATTCSAFLRSQADALLACDFIETVTLSGQCQYIPAVIEHATGRIRVLGATAHPTAAWVTQAARNLVIDLDDAGAAVRYLIRDRDATFPALFDQVLAGAGIEVVLTGIHIPRMNAAMKRRVRTCQSESSDRTLIRNQAHLLHAPRAFETHYNTHRPHRTLQQAAPPRPTPEPITEQARIIHPDIRRHDRLGGTLHEYHHAA